MRGEELQVMTKFMLSDSAKVSDYLGINIGYVQGTSESDAV